MALGDKLNKKVRGLSTDRAYTDTVIKNNGAVIVSGGTPSDNAPVSYTHLTLPTTPYV